jgi:uncharacterized repeat protein (TIGR01451 family)
LSVAINEFPVPAQDSEIEGIVSGPDGNLWFTQAAADEIGRINPTTHAITEFAIPTAGSSPTGITAGPDGNIWFTEEGGINENYVPIPVPGIGQVLLAGPATAPDLKVSGNAPDSVIVGSNLAYTLTVTNDGSAGATGVTLTDTMPFDVTFVSATGGVTPVNGSLVFAIGDLAAGASTTFTIVVTPPPPLAGVTLSDQASVSGNQSDPTPDDNSVTIPTSVIGPTADLGLSGSAPSSVIVGSNLTYTLTVTNNGGTEATDVTLTDPLPDHVTFVSATSGVTPFQGILTFDLGDLAANASSTITIVVTPPPCAR